MKKALAVILAVMLIAVCFTACNTSTGDIKVHEESLENVERGSFSNFTAVDLNGKTVTEDIFKSKKLTMINIWATFCGPCINEMPHLETLSKEYADKDFQIIGIVCDVSYENDGYNDSLYQDALSIVQATGVTYRNLLPSKSLDIIKLHEVYSVPETIFVDENGELVGQNFVGSRSLESWKAIVDSVFATMQ